MMLLAMTLLTQMGWGQVNLTNASPSASIDFSNSMPTDVGSSPSTAFSGLGFSSNPTTAGRLNSNAWALTGWSNGALAFGGTQATSNTDYTRGSTSVAVTTAGIYAYTGSPSSVSNPALLIQPGGSDFAPGTLTLRIFNAGSTNITGLSISYNLYIRNDQSRSSSFNFLHSSDNTTYTSVLSLDYASPADTDVSGWVLVGGSAPSRSTSISGITVAAGAYYYIRWSSADVTGSGGRDEIGLDDISISATFASSVTVPAAPTISSITPGNNQLSVAFTAPSSNGGASITNYEYSINGGTDWVTPSPAVTTSPLLITGLTNGTTYDIQLRAVNSAGSGVASSTVQGTPVVPPLPVSLLSFSGYKDGFRNQLRWVTASELNNSGFEVQRSTDGQNYEPIGFVNSLAVGGNSQTQLKYNFTDANPNGLKQYYRLKQMDIDGRSTLSNILLIQGDKPSAFEIASVYPNPSRGQVTVLLNAPDNKSVTIRLIDLGGRVLQTRQVNVLAGNNSIPFDISNLAKGQYLISVGEKSVKIVKE